MKPPRPHRSLKRGAILPAFTALATGPVFASCRINRCIAATKSGAAFASNEQRHMSSCAFNDIGRYRASDAEHVLYFSLQLTCGTLL
jgi:hypothetical protein